MKLSFSLTKEEKALLLMLFLVGIFYYLHAYQENNKQEKLAADAAELGAIKSALSVLEFEAKAVSVFDATRGEKLYEKNDQAALPLASLVKSMTIIKAMDDNSYDEVVISPESLAQVGENGLIKNELWDKKELSKLVLVASSNDGAHALAAYDDQFIAKMNGTAKLLGMQNTTFYNVTGLDMPGGSPGGIGSASDANILAVNALTKYPDIFNRTILPEVTVFSLEGTKHRVENTDILVKDIPDLLFSKTGFTNKAGGNLTIVFKNKDGHTIAATVLGSSIDGRFTDIEKIVNTLYNFNYAMEAKQNNFFCTYFFPVYHRFDANCTRTE